MFFSKLIVFRRVEELVPTDSGKNGRETTRRIPKISDAAKILQEDAGKGLVTSESFKNPDAIISALFPKYSKAELREILGRKYSVLSGVIKGRIEARGQKFLGFKIAHNDVLVIWQHGDKRENMSLKSVCGIELNDIAAFLGQEYQALLSRAERSMENLEKWIDAWRLLLAAGLEEDDAREILVDNSNPYFTWFLDFAGGMLGNRFKYDVNQSRHILYFRKLPRQAGKKEFFYRKKYVDFTLNWKRLIYPGLKRISKGFDFKECVLPLIVAKNPVIESVMVDILQGLSTGAEAKANLIFMFGSKGTGVYVPNKRVSSQVKGDDESLADDGSDKLDRLLLDPKLKALNHERKELIEGKVVPEITRNAAADIRTKLVQKLNAIAEIEPDLRNLNERFVKIIPDIEVSVDEMAGKGSADGLDILLDISILFAEKVPEIFKGGKTLSASKNGEEQLYMAIVMDIITAKILSTGIKNTKGLEGLYSSPSNY